MKKLSFLFISLIISFISVYSQQRILTIEEAAIGQYRKFNPKNIQQLQWRPNSETFTFVKSGSLIGNNIKDTIKTEIISSNEIFKAYNDKNLNSPTAYSQYKWLDENIIKIETSENIVLLNVNSKKIEQFVALDSIAENIDFCANSKMLAYTILNNLYVSDMQSKITSISNEKNAGIVYGKSVHREEFGIVKGTFWSTTGKKLAFYRMDETMVTQYPLVDIETRIAEIKKLRYPMAGMKSHEVTVGIYSVETGNIIYLKTGEPKEQYLTNISWSNDDKYVFVAVLNPQQNYMKFNQYDASTGNFVKTFFEEKNEKYVEPLNPIVFLKKSSDNFVWQSQRDGFNHLYLYNANGDLLKQLTKGNWVVTDFLGFDKEEKVAYYISTEKSPLERNAYSVNLENGKTTCLTPENGYHSVIISSSGKYLIDNYSSTNLPNVYNIVSSNGKKVREILNAPNPLNEVLMPEMQMFTIKAADGKTDLYGRIIKPINFDASKKYPAILYVYGGPHAQLVENSWLGGAPLWDYYMAQKGYVVITVDNRGSANRGFEFESVIHRNVGTNEALDQMETVKYLKNLGYIDEKRIGVHGWSYGGFMTINLMTTYPDVFKTGIAGGPVIDWKYYEVMYGERYMDTPQENPEGYENSSLLNKAKNLKGNLLIIHGYVDNTVVLQHSLSFIQKCIENGVMVDYFLYPEHEHNVRGMDRIHLLKKITKYFDDYL